MGNRFAKAKSTEFMKYPLILRIEYLQMDMLDKDKFKEVTLNWEDLSKICYIFGQTSIGEMDLESVDSNLKSNITILKLYASTEEIRTRWLKQTPSEITEILNLSVGHSVESIN